MASLQQEPTGVFHVVVRIEGKRYKRSLGTKDESKAVSRRNDIQELVKLIKRGRLTIPENVSVIDYVLSDGKPTPKETGTSLNVKSADTSLPIMFQQFFDAIPPGNLEDLTLGMLHIHERHLIRVLGRGFQMGRLTGQDLQQYINRRCKERTQFLMEKPGNKGKAKRTFVSGDVPLIVKTESRSQIKKVSSFRSGGKRARRK